MTIKLACLCASAIGREMESNKRKIHISLSTLLSRGPKFSYNKQEDVEDEDEDEVVEGRDCMMVMSKL